jgi:predicted porin
MKKSLFAIAAVTAFAGAAQAQSSVTVYGIVDMGYQGKNIQGYPTSATNTITTNSFAASAESSSRLGFRGTEDLGGGMSAFFTIETGLTPADQVYSLNNNRQSFVGVGQKGIGRFALGTQYTPMFVATASIDPGQGNNTIGSVIYPQGGTAGAQAAADAALTLRMNNSLTVQSDSFSGFRVGGMYSMKNSNAAQTGATVGGTNNSTLWGVNTDFTWQKLYVTAATQSLKSELDSSSTATISTANAWAVSASSGMSYVPAFTGTNTTDTQTVVGGTYDFGILKAFAGWTNRKIASNINSNEFIKRTGQQIGVRSFITPKIEGWASVGNGRYTSSAVAPTLSATGLTANFTAYQLGGNYYLSKRTNLYGIFGSTGTSSTSQTNGSVNGNAYALGVRHTF